MSRVSRCVTVAAAAALVLGGAACSNNDGPEVPVVPTEGESPGTGGPDGSGDQAAEATPSPTSTTGVPELCEELATAGDVAQILQVPMRGRTTRVFNDDFLSDSGRTGRLTCSYGVQTPRQGQSPRPKPTKPPPVPFEIAVSGYVDAEIASGRIVSTVDAAHAAGTTVQAQSVAGHDGFLLADTQDVSFVFADDVRTYVVTIRRGVVPKPAERVVLLDMAGHLLGVPEPTSSANA